MPIFKDGIAAARLMGGLAGELGHQHELAAAVNWAKHAPPPRAAHMRSVPAEAIRADRLEAFRNDLMNTGGPADHCTTAVDQTVAEAEHTQPASFGSADSRFLAAVTPATASEANAAASFGSAENRFLAAVTEATDKEEHAAPDRGSAEGAYRPRHTEIAYYDQSRSTMACTGCTRPMSRARTSKINDYECDNCHTIMGKGQLLLLCDPCDQAVCEECILATSSDDKQLMHCLNVYGFGEHLLTPPESLHYVRPVGVMQDIGARLRCLILAQAAPQSSRQPSE